MPSDVAMLGNGLLHARAIEDLSLDRRAVDSFLGQEFDREVLAVADIEMERADENAAPLRNRSSRLLRRFAL